MLFAANATRNTGAVGVARVRIGSDRLRQALRMPRINDERIMNGSPRLVWWVISDFPSFESVIDTEGLSLNILKDYKLIS